MQQQPEHHDVGSHTGPDQERQADFRNERERDPNCRDHGVEWPICDQVPEHHLVPLVIDHRELGVHERVPVGVRVPPRRTLEFGQPGGHVNEAEVNLQHAECKARGDGVGRVVEVVLRGRVDRSGAAQAGAGGTVAVQHAVNRERRPAVADHQIEGQDVHHRVHAEQRLVRAVDVGQDRQPRQHGSHTGPEAERETDEHREHGTVGDHHFGRVGDVEPERKDRTAEPDADIGIDVPILDVAELPISFRRGKLRQTTDEPEQRFPLAVGAFGVVDQDVSAVVGIRG